MAGGGQIHGMLKTSEGSLETKDGDEEEIRGLRSCQTMEKES